VYAVLWARPLLQPVGPGLPALARAQEQLARDGYCLVEGALEPDMFAALRQTFLALAEDEEARGEAPTSGRGIQKVASLLHKGAAFEALVENEVACALAEHLLGPAFLLSLVWGRVVGPSHKPGTFHAEQYQVPPPWPYPVVMTALWMIDAFTPLNGATRVVPGSHLRGRNPPSAEGDDSAVAVTGKAGTLLVCDGRLWHQSGQNVTAGERRAAVGVNYCAHWVRPQETFLRTVDPRLAQRASLRLRQMLCLDIVRMNYYRPVIG
jgi:ectoine hydroxylase-related dioxygenase (phytanoyl-CoA dioxygenase family)